MNKESFFIEEALNRFDYTRSHLKDNIKGTQIIASFLTIHYKNFINFVRSIELGIASVSEYLTTTKNHNDSLNYSMRKILESTKKYYKVMKETGAKYEKDVIVPLEESIKKHEVSLMDIFKEEKKIIDATETHKERLNKVKEHYIKWQEKFNTLSSTSKKDKKDKTLKQLLDVKKQYMKLIEEHNKMVLEQTKNHKEKLKEMRNKEINRINSLKDSFTSFFSLTQELILEGKSLSEKVLGYLKQVDAVRDMNKFALVLGRKPKLDLFEPVSFEDHGEIYQLIDTLNKSIEETKNHFTTPEDKTTQEARIAKKKCQSLLNGQKLTQEELSELAKSFESIAGQLAFTERLAKVSFRHVIEDEDAFRILGQVITSLLTISSQGFENSGFILSVVLSAGLLICSKRTSPQGKSTMITLGEMISKNSTWTKRDSWIHAINYRLTKASSKVLMVTTDNKKRNREFMFRIDSVKKNAIITELSLLAGYMSLMRVNREMGIEILLQFAGYYEISSRKLYNILLDYEGAQIVYINEALTPEEIKKLPIKKAETAIQKYDNKKLIIVKAMPYINDFITLRTILLINKSFNKKFKSKIYRQVLRLVKVSDKLRSELWKLAILDIKLFDDYNRIKDDKKTLGLRHVEEIEDTIKLDIYRSFYLYDKEIQEVS